MKTASQTGLVVFVLMMLAGCRSKTTATIVAPRLGVVVVTLSDADKKGFMQSIGLDNANIPCFTWEGKTAVVVWSDAPACSISASENTIAGALVYGGKGTLVYRGKDQQLNREIAFSTEMKGAQEGQLKINGETYDLSRGGLFLVSGVEGNVQVKQLNRDIGQMKLAPEGLVAFGQADPEIKGFFAKASKP